jgi:hypothetical protein
MNESYRRALAVMILGSVAASCDVSSCTDITCVDQTLVIAAPKSGVWQAGTYELQITHDEETAQCAFKLPDDISDATTLIDCGKSMVASFSASRACTDSCTIDDQFELRLSFDSKPSSLSIELSRDGDVVLSDSRTVEYTEFYPGGRECGGACEQARVQLVVEP